MQKAIVAGHICLDIIPGLSSITENQFEHGFKPGRLIEIGPATISTGGSVSNTGLALHRLGIDTTLIARVGADHLGKTLRQSIADLAPGLEDGIDIKSQSSTSYTIVISPADADRRFLHHPGANDDFCVDDVSDTYLADASLFHFGYPPLMAQMFADSGKQLAALFKRVKSLGLTTSLDMAYPDPQSAAGKADWREILSKTLPNVDIFVPSLDEVLTMLRTDTHLPINIELLNQVSDELIGFGAKMVLLKLGNQGLYLHTAAMDRLALFGAATPPNIQVWANFESWQPCFEVKVVGTTGSGDVTIAGFLAAVLKGLSPKDALTAALAVGACNVEAADALSGIRTWDETMQRIHDGWPRLPKSL